MKALVFPCQNCSCTSTGIKESHWRSVIQLALRCLLLHPRIVEGTKNVGRSSLASRKIVQQIKRLSGICVGFSGRPMMKVQNGNQLCLSDFHASAQRRALMGLVRVGFALHEDIEKAARSRFQPMIGSVHALIGISDSLCCTCDKHNQRSKPSTTVGILDYWRHGDMDICRVSSRHALNAS